MNQAVNPAFERYGEITHHAVDPRAVRSNQNTKHYLFYPGENIPHPEIAGGFILRGQITPVLPLPIWDRFTDVPEGLRKRVRGGSPEEPDEAMYELAPQPIFEDVHEKYGAWGVTDLPMLLDLDVREVAALNIDRTFFPAGVPISYREQEECLRNALKRLTETGNGNVRFYEQIANAYRAAIERARAFDMKLVDDVEQSIESKEVGSLSTYSAHSLRAMMRLERPRRDKAIIEGMEQQKQIVNSLPALIAGLTPQGQSLTPEMIAAIREQIKAEVLAEMRTDKPVEAETAGTPEKATRRRPFAD